MHPAPQSVAHAVLHQAAQAESLADLGSALTRRLHRLVPHDGYMLSGNDPVTGAGCFLVERDGYTCSHFRRLRAAGLFDQRPEPQRPEPPRRPPARPATAAVVLDSAAAPAPGGGAVLESMAMDGWGSELRFGLADRAARWGTLVLLRERGRPPFTPTDIDSVQQVAAPLAAALRAYVARGRPRPLAAAMPPGVLVLDADDTIAAATPTARDWLRTCFPSLALDTDEDLALTLWNFTAAARRQGDPVLSRIPTAHGFAELHAQQLTGARGGEVAVTVQAATTGRLLPAVAAWYGLTPRERTVVDQVLEGRSGKQIARTLDLSPHTANDHLKAVYRKIRVNGRDELVATLSG
ncbi:helix-turn-helix transcriptional regulator [Actinacidiphila bryophytorum]|uniref:helix-turn-helix transcriptional regulator n=1 Tax=Actinacidiphila bryophytorum TaxID=1436133 RepID=UPI0021769D34|nr:helix-turn-helix transcriptional regulator [Actinacidiphila bryophytorum]UWE07513.1 helix-turn-helix transcriptional regulator [Actinacidiphila bryophytorum]